MILPTIGIAGVSIPGAVDCIQKINVYSSKFFPIHVHPHILLDQPNFEPMQRALQAEQWNQVLGLLLQSLEALAKAGAAFAIIPANTVHKVIREVQGKSPIPVLNMLELVADECQKKQYKKIGIMGSRWTMASHLYKDVLLSRGMEEVVPSPEEQEIVQKAILSELIPMGKAAPQTLSALLQIVESLKQRGCDTIALACTELPLVLNQENCKISAIDTTEVLALAALERAKLTRG